MQLKTKLVEVLPLQTGVGKTGQEWKKLSIIVETLENYPKKICVNIWGDKINESILNIGAILDINFDVESREFNGKWYTDVKAWKVEASNETTPASNNYPPNYESLPDVPPPSYLDNNEADDLPF
ncbi:MAG: DUF3127 domain-containing protein [Bacteroidales bacterium]|jgi:hypothetical protein|nr:DUF3127 domain-containing protein [Bacteroidales bacterium]